MRSFYVVRSNTWCGPPGPQTRAQRGVNCAWVARTIARTESHAKKQRRKENRDGRIAVAGSWCGLGYVVRSFYVVRSNTWCGPPGPQLRAQRGVNCVWVARTIARTTAQEDRTTRGTANTSAARRQLRVGCADDCADRVSRKEAKTQREQGWVKCCCRILVRSRICGEVLYVVRSNTWCGPPGPQLRAQRGVNCAWVARTIARTESHAKKPRRKENRDG